MTLPATTHDRFAYASALLDEYQDGCSAGSLVQARRCWLDLLAAEALPLPQRFRFRFQCPTARMADGLTSFLRYEEFAGFVRGTPRLEVAGTTHASPWSLASLEHFFMGLRAAARRYESSLVMLERLPAVPCPR